MGKYTFVYVFFAAFLLTLFCGCHADIYYQARAVERAREFILDEAKELTLEERSFIRYNDPVLLHNPVVGSKGIPGIAALDSEQQQICVTWQLPEKEELYMVFGVSGARMDAWYPNRLIRKKFVTTQRPLKKASDDALAYARNNLYDRLNVNEFNQLRFTPPWLLRTNFELNVNPEGKLTVSEKEKIEKQWKNMVQYSLVWKFGKEDLVFAGMARAGFSGWQIIFAGLIPADEVAAHTVKVVKTPEQALEPMPEDELPPDKRKVKKTEIR